jgi:acetyl-CoA synthetase
VIVLDDQLLAGQSEEFETVETSADDPAQIYYTSGTTGLAKGILHAHRYILAHEEFLYCHDVRDGELFHGMGEWAWAAGIAPLLGPWRYGAVQFVYQREGGFDPDKQLEVLSRHGVSNVFTTPTAMRSMMGIEDAGERYPQKFRVVCSAGEPLNPEAIRWFRDQYGVTVLDFYGLSESYPLCANYPFMEVREGSMGKPMPGWDVQILDEDEKPVGVGERGEICLRARSNPHYPLGYWNNEVAARETFGGEWFHSKDAAERDEEGYFWYAGRADDVIISAGYRIGPFEVESACIEHPAVREAAAVASPDERRGNVVKAFVVLAEGQEPSDQLAKEIQGFVREHLSAYAYPRQIEFTDELPKTLTGKIRRIELREREQRSA